MKLTLRKNGEETSLEDLQIEDRKTKRMLAAESLYEQSLEEAASIILATLK